MKLIKDIKRVVVLMIAAASLFACSSPGESPQAFELSMTDSNESTLANKTLIANTMAGLMTLENLQSEPPVVKFVTQQPVGKVGARIWQEMWILRLENIPTQYVITFKELGLHDASFEIHKL